MTLIAICDKNLGIAKGGKQICTIPEDLEMFRRTTMGGTVIMGRRTFEAIGHPLLGRRNIVLSRDPEFCPDGVEIVRDAAALPVTQGERAYVIGGESVYKQLLPRCNTALITWVDADLGAGQFMPTLGDEWVICSYSPVRKYKELIYQFRTYGRRKNHD